MIPSWDALGPSLRTELQDCWECTPEIKRLVEEQIRRRTTPTEKARALAEWVRNKVRFRSADHASGIIPHTPAVTLFERCGDCKDQCQLLAVMLRAADIQVGLVYLSTVGNGQIPEDVPHYWGNHVILHVTIDGREHWVDPTAETEAWDRLPREDADRICIVFEGEGLTLRRTPPPITKRLVAPLTRPVDRHDRPQRGRKR
jgi:transglutaminase-like putative cysteine protease